MTSLSFDELPTRLDKYMRESTGLSRSQVAQVIGEERVRVNSTQPRRGGATLVFPGDAVEVDGREVMREPARSYFMLYKPSGLLTASRDPYGRPCLKEILDGLPDGVFPVGRLDKATTGLLFLTDDGDLAHMLLHPRFHIPKTYRVKLSEKLAAEDPRLERLIEGVEIGDGPARALSVEALEDHDEGSRIEMTIDEGRNRQVRRMVRAAGLHLEHLHRHAFGELELDLNSPGDLRPLGSVEVESLWRGVGGRERVVKRKLEALQGQALRMRDEGDPHQHLEAWLRARTSPAEKTDR